MIDRKAAIAAYKEQEPAVGIYAVRCVASGEVWVGQSPNLETIQNRLWFTLRAGSHSCRPLQQAWKQQGVAQFSFEILERLAESESAYLQKTLLKDRLHHWRTTLQANLL